MLLTSHWRARHLAAGLFSIVCVFCFEGLALGGAGAKPDAAACDAHEIAAAIRGCTAIVDNGARGKSEACAGLSQPRQGVRQARQFRRSHRRFRRGHRLSPATRKPTASAAQAYAELSKTRLREADFAEAIRLDPAMRNYAPEAGIISPTEMRSARKPISSRP